MRWETEFIMEKIGKENVQDISSISIPWVCCLCTPMPKRNTETELEETENVALIARQRGDTQLVPQGLCRLLEGVVRSLIVFEEQGVISSWTFFWLVGGEVIGSQLHQPSGSSWSGVYVLVGSIPLTSCTSGDFGTCKIASRTWLRILSIVFEELKVLDFGEWLSYF